MKGSHSRLLQVVIAAMLINVAPDGRAETYDLPRVGAQYPDDFWDDSAYFEADYSNWELNDYSEPSGSGNEDPDSSEAKEEDQAQCDATVANAPEGCDVRHPPELVRNGCGTGATANIVPDSLIVNGTIVSRFGNLFTSACNRHDVCYGTAGTNKDACDVALGADMYRKAQDVIPSSQWAYYESHVIVQAGFYSAFLRSRFGKVFSNQAFQAAQVDGYCRMLNSYAVSAGCSF